VREKKRPARGKPATKAAVSETSKAPEKATAADNKSPEKKTDEDRRQRALDLLVETVEALVAERGEEDKIWGSMVKQALKRRNPGFTESYHGFRSFNDLLQAAQKAGNLNLDRDEKSSNYLVRLPAHEE
jgi:hypothetical protein